MQQVYDNYCSLLPTRMLNLWNLVHIGGFGRGGVWLLLAIAGRVNVSPIRVGHKKVTRKAVDNSAVGYIDDRQYL